MSKTAKWIAAVAAGIFLILIGTSTCKDCEEPKVVTKEVCTQEETWKDLKDIDDQIIVLDGKVEIKAAEVIGDIVDGNYSNLDNHSRWMEQKLEEKKTLIRTRSSLLGELGY